MKMVKSLLLGSAAGLVAMAGAQAADLPVKAKPVEYVKVCSLYGAGYYYIPGTDICMKVGGYVRSEWSYHYGSSMTTGPFVSGGDTTRVGSNDWVLRSRAYITNETRQQTAYGTLRTYLNVGVNYDSPAANATGFSANRAFIQIAGFTFGLATSFYDFYSAAATSYLQFPSSDTGDGGYKVWAYTAQLGNGVSATISAEEPRRASVVNNSFATGPWVLNAAPTADQINLRYPDVVGNLRIDQAWGSAQIMAALHDASAGYYGTTLTGSEVNGHPSDTMGWAAGAGIKINTPFISPGDYLQAQVNYSQGAVRYVGFTQPGASNAFYFNGNTLGFGYVSDSTYCGAAPVAGVIAATATCPAGGSGVQLTTAWGVNAAYEHFWTPSLRTSVYGAYIRYSYNAAANAQICASGAAATAYTITGGSMTNCNNNWGQWGIGARTQWNVTKDFYMGFDTYYTKLQTADAGTASIGASGAKPAAVYTISDQSVWATRVRVHRDIVP